MPPTRPEPILLVAWTTASVLLTIGCAGPRAIVATPPSDTIHSFALAQASSGHVGCPPTEIEIADLRQSGWETVGEPSIIRESWTARCRGARFFCTGANAMVSCALERGESSTPIGEAP
jgi:hypothetical protein